MQAPTHAVFGLVFTVSVGTMLGVRLGPDVAAFATAGALLPDIDTPLSLVGRVCPPLSRRLERRVGHRTATHSLLALALATLPVLPLGLLNPAWPAAFALGYLSHLLIDATNKSGVPLFFPNPLRAVLPRSEAVRVVVGSRAETGLLVVLLVTLAILLPLHWMGFTRALHALTRTTGGAIADYRAWQGTHEVWAEVDGTFRLSQRRVRQRYRILGIASASTLIVDDPATGAVHTVGTAEAATIHPRAIRAERGRPVTIHTRTVELRQQLLGDLRREIPAVGESFLLGTVRTPDTPAVKPEPEQYATVEPGQHEVTLRYARPRVLDEPSLASLFVISGQVLVQTVLPAGSAALPDVALPPRPDAPNDDVTQVYIAHLTDPARELLVRERDCVRQGQLLARLTYREPEAERRREQAEGRLAERREALALQEGKARQARTLAEAGLAPRAAVDRENLALLQAREALAQAERELARLREEGRRASEIRSPVDGQVLSVRVHAVHGSEGTALVRVLYRKPAVPPEVMTPGSVRREGSVHWRPEGR